jgi:hypothetical protein
MKPIHHDTNLERLLSLKAFQWIESLGPVLGGSIAVRPLADFEIGVQYVSRHAYFEHRIQIPDAIRIFSEPKNLGSLEALYRALGPAENRSYRGEKEVLRRTVKLATSPSRSMKGTAQTVGLLGDIAVVAAVALMRFYGTTGQMPQDRFAQKLREQTMALGAGVQMLERLARLARLTGSKPELFEPALLYWKAELANVKKARSLQRGAVRMQARANASLEQIRSLGIAA